MAVDRHDLYEAAVQGVEYDLDLFLRMYRNHRGGRFTTLREDFCGTAALACAWVRRGPDRRAWGVDLDREVLDWAATHRIARMRGAARRVTLLRGDVRTPRRPRVDVVCAMNFSYWVFKQRRELVRYFRAVHASLAPRGMFVCNAFGGTGALQPLVERTRIPAGSTIDGEPRPGFTYVWEQERFNPIDHDLQCSIHFELRDGRRIRRAFHYDWRLWTLPELTDALTEAGFRGVHFYVEGWDEQRDQPDDTFRLRRRFDNQEGWLACAVALR